MGKAAIPEDVKEKTLERLHKHVQENYIGQYGVRDVTAKFKGQYLYMGWIEGPSDERR